MQKFIEIVDIIAKARAITDLDTEIRKVKDDVFIDDAVVPFLRLVTSGGTYRYRGIAVRWNDGRFEWYYGCWCERKPYIGHASRIRVSKWIPVKPASGDWIMEELYQQVEKAYRIIDRFKNLASQVGYSLEHLITEFLRVYDALADALRELSMKPVWNYVDNIEHLVYDEYNENDEYEYDDTYDWEDTLKRYGARIGVDYDKILKEKREAWQQYFIETLSIPQWMLGTVE